jgi:hypothetical protein
MSRRKGEDTIAARIALPERLLTLNEAAERLGWSRRTIDARP